MAVDIPSLEKGHPLTRGRAGIVILAALVMFGPLGIDLYLPALPTIGRALGAPDHRLQWTLTAFLTGFSLGMPIYGPISDAWGRRPVILFGAAVFIAASIVCAIASDASQLVVARLVQGAGGGAAAVMGRVIIRDIFPRDRQAAMLSLVALVTGVTPLLAPSLGGQILDFAGWRAVFWTLAGFGVLASLMVLIAVPESHPAENRGGLRLGAAFAAYGAILRHRAIWGCVFCASGAFAAMFAYIAATPFVYIEYFGLSPKVFGLLFALNILAQMVGTSTNARLVGRLGPIAMSRRGAAAGLLGGSGLVVVSLSETGLWGVVVCLLPIVGVSVMQSANMTVRAMTLFPANAGAAAGVLTSLMFAGGALATFLVSLAHTDGPLGMSVVIVGFCALSAIGVSPLFVRDSGVDSGPDSGRAPSR